MLANSLSSSSDQLLFKNAANSFITSLQQQQQQQGNRPAVPSSSSDSAQLLGTSPANSSGTNSRMVRALPEEYGFNSKLCVVCKNIPSEYSRKTDLTALFKNCTIAIGPDYSSKVIIQSLIILIILLLASFLHKMVLYYWPILTSFLLSCTSVFYIYIYRYCF